MFALIAGHEGCATQPLLAQLKKTFRGCARPMQQWLDGRGRAGVTAGTIGLLPEDIYDRQPLTERDVVFACRARLDDRDALCDALGISQIERRSLADSEIVFRSYLRWSEHCVAKIFGDYSFAAWHAGSGRLVAAVDHFASSAVYYATCGGVSIIATQLAVVLAHPEVSRDLDVAALGVLCGPKSIVGATAYRVVRAIPPGHLLICEQGRPRLQRWWSPQASERISYRDPRDYVAHASALFEGAVNTRLRAVGTIAATMSGGIDSTLVSATAAGLLARHGGELTAYTSVPDSGLTCGTRKGWDASDLDYAAAVARRYPNVRHVPVQPQGLCPLDMMPAIHSYSRTPVRNSANHLWLGRVSLRAAQSGARVVLTGQRGNFGISASGRGVPEELLWSARPVAALRCALQLQRGEQISLARSALSAIAGPLRRKRQASLASRFPGTTWLQPGFLREFAQIFTDAEAPLSPNAMRVAHLTRCKVPWSADPLIQWNVEWRDPTSDRRLVEDLLCMPLEAFVMNGRYRGLARAMGEGLLPDEVRLRRTQGSQVPEHPSMLVNHAAKYDLALATIAASPLLCSIYDMDRVRRGLRDLIAGSIDGFSAHTIDRVLDVGLFVSANEAAR